MPGERAIPKDVKQAVELGHGFINFPCGISASDFVEPGRFKALVEVELQNEQGEMLTGYAHVEIVFLPCEITDDSVVPILEA